MSTPETKEETTQDAVVTQGRVKWFNNRAGYGFITVSQGEHKDEDVFVHHSAIVVSQEQYRYLVQGEYVEFELCTVSDSDHKWQAGKVQGIDNGKLMCETRLDNRVGRSTVPSVDGVSTRGQRTTQREGTSTEQYRVHTRGRGPRDGDEWMLVRRRRTDGGGGVQRREGTRYSSPQKDTLKSRQNRAPFSSGGD